MKRRIQTTIIALAAIVGNASGQTLNVEPIEGEAGAQASLQVSLTAGTGMTALQFNLHLPEGFTLDEAAITQGEATNGHELLIRPLEGGDHLFILSSKRLNTFKDGELLRIPLNIGDDAETGDGRLHVVRMATTDAVSIACEDATFAVTASRRGDANGDGKVTVADVTAIVNHILGKPQSGTFNEVMADTNGDGVITIADVTATANQILDK